MVSYRQVDRLSITYIYIHVHVYCLSENKLTIIFLIQTQVVVDKASDIRKSWRKNAEHQTLKPFLDCGCPNNVMWIQTYLGLDLPTKRPNLSIKQYHSALCLTEPPTSGALKHNPSDCGIDPAAPYPILRINDICSPNPAVFWTNILSY